MLLCFVTCFNYTISSPMVAGCKWRARPSLLTAKHRLFGRSLFFHQKQVFGPRTAKSQPIWIKLCIHLPLYGIHLFSSVQFISRLRSSSADGRLQAKPKRLFISVILVTHPKYYIQTADRRNFGGKPSKWRWGRVLLWKIAEFCSVGELDPKSAFFAF